MNSWAGAFLTPSLAYLDRFSRALASWFVVLIDVDFKRLTPFGLYSFPEVS